MLQQKLETKYKTANNDFNFSTSAKTAVFSFTQILIRIIARVMQPFMAEIEVKSNGFDESSIKPLIFISNHKSYYDSLLIAYSFPFFSKIFPLRFITWDRFFENVFSRMLFKSMGCYPAYYGLGVEKSLEIPDKILQNKGAVVFFVEGSCFRDDVLHPVKPGAAILALKHPEAKILPFAIKNSYKIRNLFSRPKVQTAIGQPFYLKDKINMASATAESVSKIFMDEINMLFGQLE